MRLKRILRIVAALLTSIYIVTYNYLDKFSTNETIKWIVSAVAVVSAVIICLHSLLLEFVDSRYKSLIRRTPVLNLFVKTEGGTTEAGVIDTTTAKANFLRWIKQKSDMAYSNITDKAIFTHDFEPEPEFVPGSIIEDRNRDWQLYYKTNQFQVITGEAGTGKTFEMVKRLQIIYERLIDEWLIHKNVTDEKVPVYIELKSLDTALTNEWLVNYIEDAIGPKNNIKLSIPQVRHLIEQKQLAFFFDGLDEVTASCREDCLQVLIQLSVESPVYFTCRKEVYTDLYEKFFKDQSYHPAEFNFHLLPQERVREIVATYQDRSEAERKEILELLTVNNSLQAQLAIPLRLNLFLTVYNEFAAEEKELLRHDADVGSLTVLWNKYEDHIARTKLEDADLRKLPVYRRYTIWVAKIMQLKPLFVDRMQPADWIMRLRKDSDGEIVPYQWGRRLYFFITRLLTALLLGIATGCIIATPFSFVGNSLLAGFVVTLFGGINRRNGILNRLSTRQNIIFVLVLLLCCSLYQGFSIPRGRQNMPAVAATIFSIDETYSGILLSLIFSLLFSYRFYLEAKHQQSILPLEVTIFNWRQALTAGAIWGLSVGVVIGTMGVILKHYFSQSSFYSRWLSPFMQDLIMNIRGTTRTSIINDVILFVFAFTVSGSVAFFIVLLLAGRNEEEQRDAIKKKSLNYGIKSSLVHATSHAFVTFSSVAAVYLLLTWLLLGWQSLFSGLWISFGLSIIAALWFGGMEFINHFFLRINLALMKIAPYSFEHWFKINQDMAIVRKSSTTLIFYHSTLSNHFCRYRLKNNTRVIYKDSRKTINILYALCLLLFCAFLLLPFINRYFFKGYWEHPHQFEVSGLKGIRKMNDSTYVVMQSGQLQASLEGEVHVGTFTGKVAAEGTPIAMLGLPIKAAYNLPKGDRFRHAAVLISRQLPDSQWSSYQYLSLKMHKKADTAYLAVQKGQLLKIVVNDWEWQNNTGCFKMGLSVRATKNNLLSLK